MEQLSTPIFGRLMTAMVTPFTADDRVDLDAAAKLACYLVDEQRNDALVVNGTTGESPTTSDVEKKIMLEAVIAAVGDRAQVIAGVGTFSTAHTLRLADDAQDAGADGLLVVAPYYSRPPQHALAEHFLAVADATELPIMLYDIPHRSGVPIETATLVEVAQHPHIVAVKDAKGQPVAGSQVIASTTLIYYAGDDAMTLPLMSVGGAGVVGTSTHFTGALTKQLIDAFLAGDNEHALSLHQRLLPVYTGVFATQGCSMVKAALGARGLAVGGLRAPMVAPASAELSTFLFLLDELAG